MIPFNKAPYVGQEEVYMMEAVRNNKISGDGEFTHRCHTWLEKKTGAKKVLLTTSGTAALEMSALLCDVQPGDEVIMPSYTFTTTAGAFVLRGAKIVFVDIRPDTMNIDEELIEAAITERTKGIVVVHYAGVGCEMDRIMEIAATHKLWVVEDAAQAANAFYKDRPLGTIGRLGCYSFHETKNYSMGEGGALLINNTEDVELAEIIREKGTNRSQFFRGQVDKYSWVEKGSSYLPSDLNAAYLWAQLEQYDKINEERLARWQQYYEQLSDLQDKGVIGLPYVPAHCTHNGHMFYVKAADLKERTALIDYLKKKEIGAVFHYVPLHSSKAGVKYGRFSGEDRYTTKESERLVRLPMFFSLKEEEVDYITKAVREFYQ
jgi:dTDP-4-amino-4,6-dideoxygalactose transaminase